MWSTRKLKLPSSLTLISPFRTGTVSVIDAVELSLHIASGREMLEKNLVIILTETALTAREWGIGDDY